MKKIVIFDIDGTLLEDKLESRAFIKAFETSYGITGINEDWSTYPSPTDEGVSKWILNKHLGRPATADEMKKFWDTCVDFLMEIEPVLLPGVKEILDLLRSGETGLALATGNVELCAKTRLEKAGLWQYFRCGAFAEQGYNKTFILEEAINRCRRLWPEVNTNGRFVYVGDHEGDALAAHIHGVRFIGVNRNIERFKGLTVDYFCPDYLDKENFIKALERL
jgi:phosphoglycolate phosphatase-like HAD superfamily hydrolase